MTSMSLAALLVTTVFLYNIWSHGPVIATETGTLLALAESSLPGSDGANRGPEMGEVELLSPIGGIISDPRPTFIWRTVNPRATVVKIEVLKGPDAIISKPNPQGGSWQPDNSLTPNIFYAWKLTVSSDQGTHSIVSRPFYVLDQAAIEYASGKLSGLSSLQEATLLIELQRWSRALPKLQSAISDTNLTHDQRSKIANLIQKCQRLTAKSE